MREGSRGAPRRGSGAIARPHGARQHGRYFVFEDANLAVRAEAGLLGEPGVIVHQKRVCSSNHQLALRTMVRHLGRAVQRRGSWVKLHLVSSSHRKRSE